MPLTHTRSFRVRYYECDANGHLNNANYLRYMQETAFDASQAAGYGLQRYEEMKRFWLIRESSIDFFCSLKYDQQVNVTTWISDFRRASSRRMYEFHRTESKELLARGHTDWVFLDLQTNKPVAIPKEFGRDFFPEGVPDDFPAREPFPAAPPAPAGVFKVRRRVAWQDLDSMQHVNNANYLVFVNDCAMQSLAAHGWPWMRMTETGLGIFLRRVQIQYLRPALYDDELEIATWISNVRRSMATRHFTIRRVKDGALLIQAQTLGVSVDLKSNQVIRFPKEFLADLAPLLVS
jgi:acyl-CoA thioester hydrolase